MIRVEALEGTAGVSNPHSRTGNPRCFQAFHYSDDANNNEASIQVHCSVVSLAVCCSGLFKSKFLQNTRKFWSQKRSVVAADPSALLVVSCKLVDWSIVKLLTNADVDVVCIKLALHKGLTDKRPRASGCACAWTGASVVLAPEFECNDFRICD